MLASDPTAKSHAAAPSAGAPSPAAETSPVPPYVHPGPGPMPRRIGNYRIVERLGRGGYGDVYLGRHRWLGVPAAIKVLHAPVADRRRNDFVREARRLYRLRGHPGILELREFGFFRPAPGMDPVPYFASDPVPSAPGAAPGDDPATITGHARAHRLDLPSRLALFARVCDAVDHAHRQGVVHLDLKPGNILVAPGAPGRPPQPKIIDFGIARAADPGRELLARGIQGTVPYMSPEQTIAGAPLDARSDVYSLGVVLYELLCGKLPYELPTGASDAARVIREEPLDAAAQSELPRSVRDVIAGALEKDPGKRYESAASLAADVRSVISGDGPSVRRGSRWRSAIRGASARHPLVAAALIIAVSMLVTETVGVPLLYSWTSANAAFQRTFARNPLSSGLSDVVIVSRTKATDDYAKIDRRTAPFGAFRPVHARILDALAQARPRAVVFDHFYEESSGFDDILTSAISRLSAQGVPVIVGVESWSRTREGVPPDTTLIASMRQAVTRWGNMGVDLPDDGGFWHVEVACTPSGSPETLESLALATVAAAWEPHKQPLYTLVDNGDLLRVRFREPANDPRAASPVEARESSGVPLSQVKVVTRSSPGLPGGAAIGDTVGLLLVRLPEESIFRAAQVPAERILAGDADAIARCRDRIVLIDDESPGVDVATIKGVSVVRSHVHAAAIQLLWSGRAIRLPSALDEYAIPGAGALAGFLGTLPLTRRRSWWPRHAVAAVGIVWAVMLVGAIAACVIAAWYASYVCNPLVIVFAMVVAAALSVGVWRVQRIGRQEVWG